MTKLRCEWRQPRCLEEWSTANSSSQTASLPSYQISSSLCPKHPPLHLYLPQDPYPPHPPAALRPRAAKALLGCWCLQGMGLCLASAPLSQPSHILCLGLYSRVSHIIIHLAPGCCLNCSSSLEVCSMTSSPSLPLSKRPCRLMIYPCTLKDYTWFNYSLTELQANAPRQLERAQDGLYRRPAHRVDKPSCFSQLLRMIE